MIFIVFDDFTDTRNIMLKGLAMLRKNTIAIQTPFRFFNELEGYYPISGMKNALKMLTRCVKRQEGFALILGSTGTGKTLLCSLLEEKLQDDLAIVFLHNTNEFSPRALYQSILFELGRPYRRMDENEMRLALFQTMGDSGQCSDGLLIIVDEAHNLPIETLNELRLLSNGRTPVRNNISVVLSGNLQLEETLTHPKLEPLQQRTAVRICLESWTKKETSSYINARLKSFGERLPANSTFRTLPFSVEAIGLIHSATAGIPRLVIQLCDLVYLLGIEQKSERINADQVQAAWAQMQQLPSPAEIDGAQPAEESNGQENCIEFGSLDDDLQANPFTSFPSKESDESDRGTADSDSANSDSGNSDSGNSAAYCEPTNPELEQGPEQEPEQESESDFGSDLTCDQADETIQGDRASEREKIGYNREVAGNVNSIQSTDATANDVAFGALDDPLEDESESGLPVESTSRSAAQLASAAASAADSDDKSGLTNDGKSPKRRRELSPEQLAARVSHRSLVNRITERAAKPIEEIVERATDILRRLDKIEAYFTSYCTVDYVDSPLSPSDCLPDELPNPDEAFANEFNPSRASVIHTTDSYSLTSAAPKSDDFNSGDFYSGDPELEEAERNPSDFDADLDARINRRLDAARAAKPAGYQDPFAEDFEDEEAVRVDGAHPIPKSPFAQRHSGVVRSVPENQEQQDKRKGVY